MKKNNLALLLRIARITLVCLLIAGILSTSFGVVVLATSDQAKAAEKAVAQQNKDPETQAPEKTRYPTEDYGGSREGSATLSSAVETLTEEETAILLKALVSVEAFDYYGEEQLRLNLNSENLLDSGLLPEPTEQGQTPEETEDILKNLATDTLATILEKVDQMEMLYLPSEVNSILGGDRILRIEGVNSYGDTPYIQASEPLFEDSFESLDICVTEALTAENLIGASFAPGVTASFDRVPIETAATSTGLRATNLANPVQPEGGELKVALDYTLKSEEKNGVEASLKISGAFGIRDLKAHLICDMPKAGQFEDLYFGLSGETYLDVTVEGKVEGKAEPEATAKDLGLVKLEGLNEKRFPLAIFMFTGTTPVKISKAAYDAATKSLLPQLYVVVYADWEGNISLELTTTMSKTERFNNGLSVFKNGEFTLQFEDYPYASAYPLDEEAAKLTSTTTVAVKAEADLSLVSGSLLFYVAGVNMGEINVARFGLETECELSMNATYEEGDFDLEADGTGYIRGYLKMLGINIKLKMEGKAFLKNFEMNVDFEYCLLDFTLFQWGDQPEKFKPAMPISSMKTPDEFDSIFCLVVDVSGSMSNQLDSGETKQEAAQNACTMIINTSENWAKTYEGTYGIGLVQFSDYSEVVAAPHIDYPFLRDCVNVMGDGGGTAIYTGVDTGISQLTAKECGKKIMILMTDGQDGNSSRTLESAQAAADEGITIYTIGFGEGVNETLLQEVAEITGGKYQYAETENLMGIVGSFLFTQYDVQAEVIAQNESTVSEGELSEPMTFEIEEGQEGDLIVTNAWPGSFLDTILVDPNGQEVTEDYPNSVTDESGIPTTITVRDPIPGEWTVRIKGVECSYENEPFYTIVAFKDVPSETVNEKMSTLETVAGYCLPIGVIVTLSSILLLSAIGWTGKKVTKEEK